MIVFKLVLAAGAVALLTMLLNRLALWNWPKTANLHWSERARIIHPTRTSASLNLFLGAANAALFGYWRATSSPAWIVAFGAAGFVGGLVGNYSVNRRFEPRWTVWRYTVTVIRSWGAVLILGGVFAAVAWGIGDTFDTRAILVTVVFLACYLSLVTVGWYRVLRILGRVRAAAPEVEALVRDEAARLRIQVNRVALLDDFRPLAFALPFGRTVLLTDDLVGKLTAPELRKVVVHELAHLSEPALALCGRVMGVFKYVPIIFMVPVGNAFPVVGPLLLLLGVGGLAIGSVRLSKILEKRADRIAAQDDPEAAIYASALEKIYALNLVPASGIARGRSHPDLYDRMLAAGIQPGFERPEAPDEVNWTLVVWMALCFGQFIPACAEYFRR